MSDLSNADRDERIEDFFRSAAAKVAGYTRVGADFRRDYDPDGSGTLVFTISDPDKMQSVKFFVTADDVVHPFVGDAISTAMGKLSDEQTGGRIAIFIKRALTRQPE